MHQLSELLHDRKLKLRDFQPLLLSFSNVTIETNIANDGNNQHPRINMIFSQIPSIRWKSIVDNYHYSILADKNELNLQLKICYNDSLSIFSRYANLAQGHTGKIGCKYFGTTTAQQVQSISCSLGYGEDYNSSFSLDYKYKESLKNRGFKTGFEFILGQREQLVRFKLMGYMEGYRNAFNLGFMMDHQIKLWMAVKRPISNGMAYLNYCYNQQSELKQAIIAMYEWKLNNELSMNHGISSNLELYNQIVYNLTPGIQFGYSMYWLLFIYQLMKIDQTIGQILQLIAIVAFTYGTFTTFAQPLLDQQQSWMFLPRVVYNVVPSMLVIILIGAINYYFYKQSQKQKTQ